MRYQRKCDCCGTIVTAYTVVLNTGLIQAFLKLTDARVRLGRAAYKSELNLDHSQYGNFQKLKHFGLVIHGAEVGQWDVTPTGWDFLLGITPVISPAGQMGNITLEANHPAWKTHTSDRRALYISDLAPEDWKRHAEYAQEKRQ